MPGRIAIFQHAPSEGPGHVLDWLQAQGFAVQFVKWWESGAADSEALPTGIDGCVILGGAMNIYQHRDYPWLIREKESIAMLLERGCPILGICLGAQLLADALGARVVQNPQEEIGWWPVQFTEAARKEFPKLPQVPVTVMHWHGDTFSLPHGATRLASSDACPEQGFLMGGNVVGLQFHPEVNERLLQDFCGTGESAWPSGKWVQDREQILDKAPEHFANGHAILETFLSALFTPHHKA